jgi:hypothetical protein
LGSNHGADDALSLAEAGIDGTGLSNATSAPLSQEASPDAGTPGSGFGDYLNTLLTDAGLGNLVSDLGLGNTDNLPATADGLVDLSGLVSSDQVSDLIQDQDYGSGYSNSDGSDDSQPQVSSYDGNAGGDNGAGESGSTDDSGGYEVASADLGDGDITAGDSGDDDSGGGDDA